jgi:hypothetical protein
MENNKYLLSKNAIGILLLVIGPPFFYFIRAQLHIGGGSVTSGVFYLMSLFLISTPLHPKLGFRPNVILLQTGGLFFLFTMIYFFLLNREPQNRFLDLINIAVIILFFILIIRVDNQIQKFLPFWIIIISLIINVILLYSVLKNPNYALGLRATVQFGEEDFSGNPGIYARDGLIGVTICLLFLFKQEDKLFQQESIYAFLIALINFILSVITIILTQTRMVLLSTIIILIAFIFFVKKNKVKSEQSGIKKKYTYLSLLLIVYYINIKYQIFKLLEYYINSYWVMFERAIMTGLTLGQTRKTEIDPSAMGRVDNIKYFSELLNFEKYNLIFGKGWRYKYIDIPILEVFINFGIFGLILFALFLIFYLFFSIKSLKSDSIFQNFLGLFSISILFGMISAGRPMDLGYWLIFILYIRFLGVKYQ